MIDTPPDGGKAGEWSELVRRVAASQAFSRAQRLRDFLLYIGERAVEGRTDEITEQQIGVHVFGRKADYSPAEDNVVRATARTLRVRLKEYFETEGAGEPWRIEIPKGTYVPAFLPVMPEEQSSAAGRRVRWFQAAVVILLVAAAALLVDNLRLRTAAGRLQREPVLWDQIFPERVPVQVVLADSSLGILQAWSGRRPNVEAYAAGTLWDDAPTRGITEETERLRARVAGTRLLSYETVNAVFRVLHDAIPRGVRLDIRYPRDIRMRDFKRSSFLLLGGPRVNPWTALFESGLNFQLQFDDPSSLAIVRNCRPREGEPPEYLSTVDPDKAGRSYARLAVVPNLSRTGKVLLLAGTTTGSTEAAGECLFDPKAWIEIQRLSGRPVLKNLEAFEVLIEVTSIQGAPSGYRVVAGRW